MQEACFGFVQKWGMKFKKRKTAIEFYPKDQPWDLG